jgi:hypothetical protein
MATSDWCSQYLDMMVEVLAARSSNHKPLNLELVSPQQPDYMYKSFKFEASWNLDVECPKVVKAVYGGG